MINNDEILRFFLEHEQSRIAEEDFQRALDEELVSQYYDPAIDGVPVYYSDRALRKIADLISERLRLYDAIGEAISAINAAKPNGKAPNIPDRQHDYTDFFDDARLTDIERDDAELHYKHGMPVKSITTLRKRHRKTIQDALGKIDMKLNLTVEPTRDYSNKVGQGVRGLSN